MPRCAVLIGPAGDRAARRARRALARAIRAVIVPALVGLTSVATTRAGPAAPAPEPALTYRARIYHVTGCPRNSAGDRFLGLSNLLVTMGRGGLKFYKSGSFSPVAGPAGIIAAADVVIVKINYQWEERGGTDTDLLRGLIRAILDHPDGFVGEVVVCENAQFVGTGGFDRERNNAQDQAQSPHDVVAGFQAGGAPVSLYDWTPIRATQVGEYSAGDMADGYIVEPYSEALHGKVSYPKFRTPGGAYVSLRHGVWNPASGTYVRTRLKFINLPVLKSHHYRYGATACTKNYMGVVTDQFETGSHNAVEYGLLGALMGQIGTASLNILDAIWINADPGSGPGTEYAEATRRDELVAGLDPIGIDIWAVKNILVPGFVANGHTPPWPEPSADPDQPESAFRTYLDNSMAQLLQHGDAVTNDLDRIDVWNGDGAAGDLDGNGTVDAADFDRFTACFTGLEGAPPGPGCSGADFDADGDVDCEDFRLFRAVWTGPGAAPELSICVPTGVPADSVHGTALSRPIPNPTAAGTRVAYLLAVRGPVRLEVYDARGRLVARLVGREESAGPHLAIWDGRDARGGRPPSGVYFCRLTAAGQVLTRRLTLVK